MTGYEYIRVRFDFGDLAEINRLSRTGWRVVTVVPLDVESDEPYYALMERALLIGESSRAPEGTKP